MHRLIIEHLADHYAFYGESDGVRIARKHLGWYTSKLAGGDVFRAQMNRLESSADQVAAVDRYFKRLAAVGERLVFASEAQIEASWVEEALAA
jgi:tRNA-dihydrouridine synthase B